MTRFALKTLFADRGKLLAAITGVVFSLVLVNIQGGLYFGLIDRASLLVDIAEADIWIGHRLVENVDFAKEIPVAQIMRIKELSGVKEAHPYVVGKGIATLPDGGFEDVWVIGCDPVSWMGGPKLIAGSRDDVAVGNYVSMDELDRPKLGNGQVGDVIEVNGVRAEIAAMTHGQLGFITTPNLFTNLSAARRITNVPDASCHYFLVKAESREILPQLVGQLRERLPDLDVFTADQFGKLSRDYWMKRTGIGMSFGASTFLGLLVGLVMVGQSLYALALDHLSDYATLRAMGAKDSSLSGIVFLQASAVAFVGSLVGLALVIGIRNSWNVPLAPLNIPWVLTASSIGLVFGLCFFGAMLPLRRVRKVDPMMVLQG